MVPRSAVEFDDEPVFGPAQVDLGDQPSTGIDDSVLELRSGETLVFAPIGELVAPVAEREHACSRELRQCSWTSSTTHFACTSTYRTRALIEMRRECCSPTLPARVDWQWTGNPAALFCDTGDMETTLADQFADDAVVLVERWLSRAHSLDTSADRATTDQLKAVVTDEAGVAFVMRFVDRVVRPDDDRVAARQLRSVVAEHELPGFLSLVDRVLLRAGARLGPVLPQVVMPLARRRMRALVGHLVAPAEPERLHRHLEGLHNDGFASNVNLLGEAVLGETEANRRLEELLTVIEQPDIDYVSVKMSAIASQLNHHAYADSLTRVIERVQRLIAKAAAAVPPTFVNFDMEEYHDLHLTMDAFVSVLSEERFGHVDAGIVLQAYLPDSWPALQQLVAWGNERYAQGGGEIKIRLVKGANLAMEQVDAAIHGWEQAPYETKLETDANYKRCLDWLLHPNRMTGVRVGVASHNLFDVAWTHLLADARGVQPRVQFEMLQGMAPAQCGCGPRPRATTRPCCCTPRRSAPTTSP